MNWMSDRVKLKNKNDLMKHKYEDAGEVDIENAENPFDDDEEKTSNSEESYTNDVIIANKQFYEDSISYLDEKKDDVHQLDVKQLESMLIPLPGQQGGEVQLKIFTDL